MGRASRPMRRTACTAPKISALPPRPAPHVIGQFETSVKPSVRSKFVRYRLKDQRLAGSTSPVGTNHSPVSPMAVVVAGRVAAGVVMSAAAGRCVPVGCAPWGEVAAGCWLRLAGVDDVCADAVAPSIATTATTATTIAVDARFHIRTRLRLSRHLLPAELVAPIRHRCDFGRCRTARSLDQAPAAAAADLTTLAPRRARFLGRPLVGRPFLVGGATALARNFALLLGGHRREPAALLAFTVHHSALCGISHNSSLAGGS